MLTDFKTKNEKPIFSSGPNQDLTSNCGYYTGKRQKDAFSGQRISKAVFKNVKSF